MPLVRVKDKAQITLPAKVRKALGIEEGDYLDVQVRGNTVTLTPQTVTPKLPPVELSARGETMLAEAFDDIRMGRVREHESAEALTDELREGM